ncbi:MAG: hypothetical protein DWQ01_17915 [Planctomycetota bacterium]|nr:MAG: hypothetical protein DWQ01_17915 [Planctomycetota bacterium]
MSKTKISVFPLIWLAAALPAQQEQGTVQAKIESSEVSQAVQGDEGQLRYEILRPFDSSAYQVKPMPATSGISTGPKRALTYDLLSGEEQAFDPVTSGLPNAGWVVGRNLADEVGESLNRSFGQLQGITSSAFPWSAHARMFFQQSGIPYLCSGTLVDARTMMTAGHCVHEGFGGQWSTNVSISPSWDGDDDAFGSANGVLLSSWSNWVYDGDYAGDIGWVRLDRPVGFLTGWFGYGYNDDNNWWNSTSFWMTGYPGGCFSGAPDTLYYAGGTWDSVGSHIVEADMNESCWIGGMSGGGIYYHDGFGNRYVYANVSHGWGWPTSTTRMGARRIESSAFDWMVNSFIPDAYSTTQEDYIPLRTRVDMGGSSVVAGEAVAHMDYTIFNTSKYDPPSTQIDVDVYLSSNDNISEFDTHIQRHYFNWDFGPMGGVIINVPPPTIPANTLAGNYFLGVIVDEVDLNQDNNDTDGWDAAPITVVNPYDSITLTGPAFADVGSTVTYNVADAPASSPAWMYWSRSNTGTTINGHPFEIGSPYGTVATGTTSSTGTWSVVGTVPPALSGVKIWLEVRVDSAGVTYDSNTKTLRGN